MPFERTLVDRLLRGTIGWSPTLMRHWGTVAAPELVDALVAWEPTEPHTDRWLAIARSLRTIEEPALAPIVGDDNLSSERPPPPSP